MNRALNTTCGERVRAAKGELRRGGRERPVNRDFV
jgi:hypothetical protein